MGRQLRRCSRKAVEYTAEERQQRISEVEALWQRKPGHRYGGHWEAVFVSAAEALAGTRYSQNRIAKKRTRTCGKKAKWKRRGHAFGPHLRTQQFLVNDGWPRMRSIDMPSLSERRDVHRAGPSG